MLASFAKRPRRYLLSALAAAAGLAAAPIQSQAQQPVLTQAVWCDKAEQIESVLRSHLGDGVALPAAIARANADAKDDGACIAAAAIVVELGEASRFVAGNQLMAVGQFIVVGVVKDGQVLQIQPVVWYAAKVMAQLTPV